MAMGMIRDVCSRCDGTGMEPDMFTPPPVGWAFGRRQFDPVRIVRRPSDGRACYNVCRTCNGEKTELLCYFTPQNTGGTP